MTAEGALSSPIWSAKLAVSAVEPGNAQAKTRYPAASSAMSVEAATPSPTHPATLATYQKTRAAHGAVLATVKLSASMVSETPAEASIHSKKTSALPVVPAFKDESNVFPPNRPPALARVTEMRVVAVDFLRDSLEKPVLPVRSGCVSAVKPPARST